MYLFRDFKDFREKYIELLKLYGYCNIRRDFFNLKTKLHICKNKFLDLRRVLTHLMSQYISEQ